VQESERLAGAIDYAQGAELAHDGAHRQTGSVHVSNEGYETLLLFIDHNAHARLLRARVTYGARPSTVGDRALVHKG
jgi:hypothetical protein